MQENHFDTIIAGAGAAGMMCAPGAARGGTVLILDHAKAPGEKIRISGGGRCNFTNIHCTAQNFISENPHFAKSALARYTARDFLALVEAYGIAWHERSLGQLFCDNSAKDIIALLLAEMDKAGVKLHLETAIADISHADGLFRLRLEGARSGPVTCRKLVIATGGKSIPKMGATGFAFRVAQQFALEVMPPRPGLVPFVLGDDLKARMDGLAGISLPVRARAGGKSFDEAMLFTHRGLSGPALLQVSSYWQEGTPVSLHLHPEEDWLTLLKQEKDIHGGQEIATVLGRHLPKRLAVFLAGEWALKGRMAEQGDKKLAGLAARLASWEITPAGTEGYRTAEVTVGGVATAGLNSRTMEANAVPGLYFIGEAVDVTGWLGGYNFQWAWASGHAAGEAIGAQA